MTPSSTVPAFVRTAQPEFLASLDVDQALVRYDLAGSVAHVEMLGRVRVLPPSEAAKLIDGLREIAAEVAHGSFPWRNELEDVHTNIEVRLTELVGPIGGKLHTARSRNDQVALAERLWARAAMHSIADRLLRLEESLLRRAGEEATTPMPGFTHLQRAQVVSVGHWLLAHFWRFDRDLDRLFATADRVNVSPLGAGALAGSTLPIDPDYVAHRLGFDHAFDNSMDAVSDRDPFAELLFDLALLAVHASGLGEEVVVFASKEFGFLERGPALGSGSSLMPQKRNPDVAELVRGKAARTVGDLVTLLTVLKGLPLTYNRDLQEDKAPVFDSVETVTSVLTALDRIVPAMRFDRERLRAAAQDSELYATDVAEELVSQGESFRSAHDAVGQRFSVPAGPESGAPPMSGGSPAESPPAAGVDPDAALVRRASPGGPSSAEVARQISGAQARLAMRRLSLSSLGHKVRVAEEVLSEETK